MSEEPKETKPVVNTGTVAGALAALAGVAMLFNIDFTAEDAKAASDAIDLVAAKITQLTVAITGLVGVWHALDKKIKFPWEK